MEQYSYLAHTGGGVGLFSPDTKIYVLSEDGIKISTLGDLYFLKEFRPRVLCVDSNLSIDHCDIDDLIVKKLNNVEVHEFVFDRPQGVLRTLHRDSIIVYSDHCPLSSICPYTKVCEFAKYCEISFKSLDDYSFKYLNFNESYNFRALGYIIAFIDTLLNREKSDFKTGKIILRSNDRAVASIYEFLKCVGMFNNIENIKVGREEIYIHSQHVANIYRKFSTKACENDRFPIYAYLLRNFAVGYVKALIDLGVVDATKWMDDPEIYRLSEYHKLIPDPMVVDKEVSIGAKIPVLLKTSRRRYSGDMIGIKVSERDRLVIAASVPVLLRTIEG